MKNVFYILIASVLFISNPAKAIIGPINGATVVCAGSSITLSDTTIGGLWYSSNPVVATVDSNNGIVRGLTSGVISITYSIGTLYATYTISVDTIINVAPIIGDSEVCKGSNIIMADSTHFGVWGSSNSIVCAIFPDGLIRALNIGVDTIYYTITNSCGTFTNAKTITVNPLPSLISLPTHLCIGSTFQATDSTIGGIWSTLNGNASIDTTGMITCINTGMEQFFYTLATSCKATANLIIDRAPSAINIDSTICVGNIVTASDSSIGGWWTSNDISLVRVVDSFITGLSSGTAIITYSDTNSCGIYMETKAITINPNPGLINVANEICIGSTMIAIDSSTGGTWHSLFGLISIDSTGHYVGLYSGDDDIEYILPTGCFILAHTTVSGIPSRITGDSLVCVGSSITLTDTCITGHWFSSVDTIASVIDYGGISVIEGLRVGSVNISDSNLCGIATKHIIVNANAVPSIITGDNNVCQMGHITLSDSVAGGIWESWYDSVATIDSSGVLTGLTQGVNLVIYKVSNNCGSDSVAFMVFVNPLPIAGTIVGSDTICMNGTGTLIDTTAFSFSSAVWSSTNSNLSEVTGGLYFGNNTGWDTVKYKVSNSCGTDSATKIIFIKPLPVVTPILGVSSLCAGASITLTDVTIGGTWSNVYGSISSVSGGVVYGLIGGEDTIKYSVSNSCGTVSVTKLLTINPLPSAGIITCTDSLCIGDQVILIESEPTGNWANLHTHITISGDTLTALSAGIDTIVFSVTNLCGTVSTSKPIYIKTPPNAGIITGQDSVCVGGTLLLTDTVMGGTWTSGTGLATVTGGLVIGNLAGIDTIYYTINSCGTAIANKPITISSLPIISPITGLDSVCVGSTIMLTDSTIGGNWTAFNANTTVINGLVKGIDVGIDTIKYSVSNRCGTWFVFKMVDVLTVPVPEIIGLSSVCKGATIGLNGLPIGGNWLSTNTNATIAGNNLTAMNAGVDTIKYTILNMCGVGATTVGIAIDTALIPKISGQTFACVGGQTTLNALPIGGSWKIVDSTIGSVTGGVVTGITNGLDTVYYTVVNVCGAFSDSFSMEVYTKHECDSINGVDKVQNSLFKQVRIYPNPTKGVFTIEISGQTINSMVSLKIINPLGQLVFSEQILIDGSITRKELELDKSLSNGVYLLTIKSDDKNTIDRIILNR